MEKLRFSGSEEEYIKTLFHSLDTYIRLYGMAGNDIKTTVIKYMKKYPYTREYANEMYQHLKNKYK